MVLVVGATGVLGMTVCRMLREKGVEVRALVRPGASREAEVKGLGVDVVAGDLKDAASLEKACAGVEAVVSTATSTASRRSGDSLRTVDRDGQLALVAAAKKAGVQRFVFVSLSPNHTPDAPLMAYKREVEAAIRASGMRYTILQPSNFMEIWFSPVLKWDLKQGKGQIFGKGDRPISWISIEDVAKFAVIGATDARAENRVLPLGGPEAVTPLEVVNRFEKITGRKFKVAHVPAGVLNVVKKVAKPFSEQVASGAALGAKAAEGDVIDMAATLKEFPVELVSVDQFCRKAIA